MIPYVLYGLEVQCDGLFADVWLNGIRVFREDGGGRRFSAKRLNPWIVDGVNTLQARAARRGTADPYLKIAVSRRTEDKDPNQDTDDDFLLRYEWQPDDPPLEEDLVTLVEQPFDVGPAHGPWLWQSATPYTEADRPAVEAAVVALHGALGRRDVQAYVDLLQVKKAEMARALDSSEAFLESDLRDALAERFGQSDWHMDPLEPSTLRIEPSADGRLVTVTSASGGSPVRGAGSETDYELGELTYSHLPQGWTVVR